MISSFQTYSLTPFQHLVDLVKMSEVLHEIEQMIFNFTCCVEQDKVKVETKTQKAKSESSSANFWQSHQELDVYYEIADQMQFKTKKPVHGFE